VRPVDRKEVNRYLPKRHDKEIHFSHFLLGPDRANLTLMPERPLQVAAIRRPVFREMFGYGVNTYVYAVGAIAVAKTGEVIVGSSMPPEHITYYTLALMPHENKHCAL
jgi:hypothetical protein